MKLEIKCPLHGETETLDLPDSYKDFEGEVLCPTPVTQGRPGARLNIKVKDGVLVSVARR